MRFQHRSAGVVVVGSSMPLFFEVSAEIPLPEGALFGSFEVAWSASVFEAVSFCAGWSFNTSWRTCSVRCDVVWPWSTGFGGAGGRGLGGLTNFCCCAAVLTGWDGVACGTTDLGRATKSTRCGTACVLDAFSVLLLASDLGANMAGASTMVANAACMAMEIAIVAISGQAVFPRGGGGMLGRCALSGLNIVSLNASIAC